MITALEPWLAPAGPQTYAVQMAKLMEFARTFDVKVPNERSAQKIYRETLGVLPADLLALAITRTIETWRWGNRLPMPGDIRATVRDDLARRRNDLSTLRIASSKAVLERRMPTLSEQIDVRLAARG